MTKNNKLYFSVGSVLIISILVYINSLGNGIVNIDGANNLLSDISNKPFSAENLRTLFTERIGGRWQPFVALSFILESKFFGAGSTLFHYTNLLLHVITVLLCCVFIQKLFNNPLTTFLGGLLFAIHPIHVEAINSITGRSELLCAAFLFGSMLFYLKYIDGNKAVHLFILSIIMFVFSLLASPVAVVLPVLLFIIDYAKARKISVGLFFEKLLFLVPAVFVMIVYLSNASHDVNTINLTSGIIVTSFIQFFVPVKAVTFYTAEINQLYPLFLWVFLIVSISLIIVTVLIKKVGKNIIISIWLFILFQSLYGLVVINEPDSILLSNSYIASFGLALLVASIFTELAGAKIKIRITAIIIVLLVSGFFGYETWSNNKIWMDDNVFFKSHVQNFPDEAYGYIALGDIKLKSSDLRGARGYYNQALEKQPSSSHSKFKIATVQYFIGNYSDALDMINSYFEENHAGKEDLFYKGAILNALGMNDSAVHYFSMALSLDTTYAIAYTGRAQALISIGRNDLAIADFEKALSLNPDWRAYFGRAKLRLGTYYFDGALNDLNEAINLNPENGELYYYRAGVHKYNRDFQAAINDYKSAIKKSFVSYELFYEYGYIEKLRRNYIDAIENFSRAISINPNKVEAYNIRGISKQLMRDYFGAVGDYSKAIAIDSTFANAYNNRALVYRIIDKKEKACEDWERALELGYLNAERSIDLYCK